VLEDRDREISERKKNLNKNTKKQIRVSLRFTVTKKNNALKTENNRLLNARNWKVRNKKKKKEGR
jgi:hypothetical protein